MPQGVLLTPDTHHCHMSCNCCIMFKTHSDFMFWSNLCNLFSRQKDNTELLICIVRACFLTWKTGVSDTLDHFALPQIIIIIIIIQQPFMPLLADGLHNLVVGLNQETHHAGSGRLGGLASCHSGLTAWPCGRLYGVTFYP